MQAKSNTEQDRKEREAKTNTSQRQTDAKTKILLETKTETKHSLLLIERIQYEMKLTVFTSHGTRGTAQRWHSIVMKKKPQVSDASLSSFERIMRESTDTDTDDADADIDYTDMIYSTSNVQRIIYLISPIQKRRQTKGRYIYIHTYPIPDLGYRQKHIHTSRTVICNLKSIGMLKIHKRSI